MGWRLDKLIDPAAIWGTVGTGVAIDGIIVGAKVALNANNPHFRWWWPTNAMIVGVVLVAIGLVLLIVSITRSPLVKNLRDKVFKGSSEQAKVDDAKVAEDVAKHIELGQQLADPGPNASNG